MTPPPLSIAVAVVAGARLRAWCRTLLCHEPDISVIAEAPPTPRAIAAVTRARPAIVLLGVRRVAPPVARALSTVEGRCPGTRVLLLGSHHRADATVLYALRHGVHGYLDLRQMEPSLATAVRALDRGEPWLPRRLATPILAALTAACASSTGADQEGSSC